ncbi:CocE/NonD family hydrolase [Nocardioides sp.]|uniref:CocE/NonD family hydrolase n=1 Tax=Nocardioides sp. TaxID=35761 RepID=UPI003D0CCCFC
MRTSGHPLPETDFTVHSNIEMAMRDGTLLKGDLFLPRGDGPFPTVLIRTPYGRHTTLHSEPGWSLNALEAARAGYAVLIQGARGTFDSEGEFVEFLDEAQDGEDSVAWVAAQAWCNGSVGMVGVSYLGITQLLAAANGPDALRAIVPGITASEAYNGWTYQGGAFNLGLALSWNARLALARLERRAQMGEDVANEKARIERIFADPVSAMETLPLTALADGVSSMSTYTDWLAHPSRDHYWAAGSVDGKYDHVRVPALHTGGLYDCFIQGTLRNYVGLRQGAATKFARENQRLILTPWGHIATPTDLVGDLWLGPEANFDNAALPAETQAWMDTFLKGKPADGQARVKVFVMGSNTWRTSSDWPLPEATPTHWFLRSDGRLSQVEPGAEAPDHFTYDPRNPVPTTGGSTRIWMAGMLMGHGPRDRSAIELRGDVLTYTSEVLDRDLEMVGPVTVTLVVSSSAPDTDFTAALVDVHPDGRAIGLTDGILRMRYRNGFETPEMLTPGVEVQIEIDLVAVANVFKVGHRIRVEVSSSNFPRFDRNPNSGGPVAGAREDDMREAHQCVFHDDARRSYITLPQLNSHE